MLWEEKQKWLRSKRKYIKDWMRFREKIFIEVEMHIKKDDFFL